MNQPDFILIDRGNLLDRTIFTIDNDVQQTDLLLDIRDGCQEEVTIIDQELYNRWLSMREDIELQEQFNSLPHYQLF